MGGAHLSREYRERLDTQIEDSYSSLCKQNNAKNVFTAVRTPTVFLSLILFFWFLKYVVSFVVTIVLFERLVGFLIFMSFAALAVWAYGRWSGYWRDAAQVIDYVSEFLWDQVCLLCDIFLSHVCIELICAFVLFRCLLSFMYEL